MFDNNLNNGRGLPRPSTHWNSVDADLHREFTPLHQHEFGLGGDIQYKDAYGNVQAAMDGLTPAEIQYLKSLKR